MKTVPQTVSDLIRQKPFLEQSLSDGLINLSALAQHLQPQIEKLLFKKVSKSSIIMALKRLTLSPNHKKLNLNLSKFIKDIIVRSNLVDFTYLNSPSLTQKHQLIFNSIVNNSQFFAVSQGTSETTLLFSQSLLPLIESVYATEKLLFQSKNLATISIRLSPEATTQPGIHYTILKLFAWEGINICEIISTYTELNIFLEEDDVNQAFSALKTFI